MLLLEVRVIVAAIDGGGTSGGRQLLVLDDYLVPAHVKKVIYLYLIILQLVITRPSGML